MECLKKAVFKKKKKKWEHLHLSLVWPTHGIIKGKPVGKDQCPRLNAHFEQPERQKIFTECFI